MKRGNSGVSKEKEEEGFGITGFCQQKWKELGTTTKGGNKGPRGEDVRPETTNPRLGFQRDALENGQNQLELSYGETWKPRATKQFGPFWVNTKRREGISHKLRRKTRRRSSETSITKIEK